MFAVGEISGRVIALLQLNIREGTPIFMGDSNIKHMQLSHPKDYEKYKNSIPDIIANPDYIGLNPKDQSIEYIKEFIYEKQSVKVAVRVSSNNIYFARSIYARENQKVARFVKKGYLLKY